MKLTEAVVITLMAVCIACATWTEPVRAACSDEEFLKAEALYQEALKEGSPDRKIELLQEAFKLCPSHGGFAEGYHHLGKLLYDRGDREKAMNWLVQANRFRAVMLQRSSKDLAETNLLLGNLYRDRGEAEKALIHLNIYKALTRFRDKKLDQDYLENADAFFSVIYSPTTVKQILVVDRTVEPRHRAQVNRLEVYFDFAKATLDEEAKKRLDGIGQALQGSAFDRCSIIVEGHTDQSGGKSFNCALGTDRARAVADYLKTRWKVDKAQLVPISFGKSMPAIGREESNRSRWPTVDRFNRRVVIWNAGAQPVASKDLTVEFQIPTPCPAK